MRFAPTTLLSAAATEAGDDPHLQSGVHLRVLLSGGLGLPVAPLIVERLAVANAERVAPDPGVAWTDLDGRPLALPIDLSSVRVAVGWFAASPGDPVLWAEVLFDSDKDLAAKEPAPNTTLPTRARPSRFTRPTQVEAVISGPVGDSLAARATGAPFQVAATGMTRVRVSGSGSVTGIRVLRLSGARRTGKAQEWRQLALPVDNGVRYRGIQNAFDAAMARVVDGAPQRVGLHDQPTASGPAGCSTVGAGEEKERVDALWEGRLRVLLDTTLNDTTGTPGRVRLPAEAMTGTRSEVAAMAQPALAGLLHASLDAGVGRLLGLVDRDGAPPVGAGGLVVYVVRGAFVLRPADLEAAQFDLLAVAGSDDPDGFPLPLPDAAHDGSEGSFADLVTAAVAMVGGPAAAPVRPAVGPAEDIAWLPATPEDERRHIVLPLSRLGPGAGLAVARDTPGVAGLNTRLPEVLGPDAPDRAVPIVCGVLREQAGARAATGPGQGEVHDRGAGADAAEYRVAQQDWFGRWSPWTSLTAPAGIRPPVPAPVITVDWVPPPEPGDAGQLVVSAVQPRDADLAPGLRPLLELSVTADVGGAADVVATVLAERGPEPHPDSPVPLRAVVHVPGLAPAEARRLAASAVWRETAIAGGTPRHSAPSATMRVTAADPRPPAAMPLPPTLTYTGRPDAVGRAHVRLAWPAQAQPVAYRVYHATETTLRQYLTAMPASPAVDALQAALTPVDGVAPPAPDRAAAFTAADHLFDRDAFQLLTTAALTTPAPGELTFDHQLSATLDTLAFYRIVPLTGQNAEARFTDCTLLVRKVPNSPPPSQPSVAVQPVVGVPGSVQLFVDVPQGSTAPAALRIRRTRVGGADALAMPIVATVADPGWTSAARPPRPGSDVAATTTWRASVVDTGTLPGVADASLAPWLDYSWRVEVQGGPEPGTAGMDALPSRWSTPSAAASLQVVPPVLPAASPGAASRTGTGVDLTFGLLADVLTAPRGTYTIEVYCRSAGVSRPVAALEPSAAHRAGEVFGVLDTQSPPAGSTYTVAVVDRLGRRSPSTEVASLDA